MEQGKTIPKEVLESVLQDYYDRLHQSRMEERPTGGSHAAGMEMVVTSIAESLKVAGYDVKLDLRNDTQEQSPEPSETTRQTP